MHSDTRKKLHIAQKVIFQLYVIPPHTFPLFSLLYLYWYEMYFIALYCIMLLCF